MTNVSLAVILESPVLRKVARKGKFYHQVWFTWQNFSSFLAFDNRKGVVYCANLTQPFFFFDSESIRNNLI